MQTARIFFDKDPNISDADNDEIIIAALFGRIDNKLGKAETLMPGFLGGVLKSLYLHSRFFADCLHPSKEIRSASIVIELKNFDLELETIIGMLEFPDRSDVILRMVAAIDRLSDCSQLNVAQLIYGFILAESWEKSENTRSMIAQQLLKIEELSPSFGAEVIPILWQGGQEDESEYAILRHIPPQEQIDALNEFADNLKMLTTHLEKGEAGNATEEFNSLYNTLPTGTRGLLLDVIAVVGEEMVSVDRLCELME
jgi:hypothetical protein